MARRFLVPLDLTGNEIRNVVAQNLSSAPGSPVEGQFYYDTTAHMLYWRSNSGWVAATSTGATGAAGGDLTGTYPNPTITNSAVTGAKVNAASVGQVLLLSGTASSRPAAAAGNSGLYYLATDTNGGTLYQSTGSAWTQVSKGVTESATPSGTASGDLTGTYPSPTITSGAVTSTKINAASVGTALLLTGIAASRPAAAAGNSGLYYFATDTNGGTLFQSTGSAWTQITRGLSEVELLANKNAASGYAGLNSSSKVTSTFIDLPGVAQGILLSGTTASRPAAAAANNGMYYFATDTNGGTLYQSNGGGWVQLTRGLTEVELLANKNAANGYAGLSASSLVALAQLPVATSGTNSSTQVVRADDSRLSDTRTPTAGSVVDSSVSSSAAIAFSKIATPAGDISWGSHKITNLLDPTNPQDAATKNYVDTTATGLDFKASTRAATTGALPNSPTYANGTAGVGATLTAGSNAALPAIDGVSLSVGERLLVKNEAATANNGIYTVTAVGSGAAPWVLTRATDFDQTAEVTAGALTYVESGTSNGTQQWILSTTGAITIGTTGLSFTQFSGASVATAGNGLTASGNVFAVGAGTGISVAADAVAIDTAVVVRKYAQAIVGSATSEVITHNLGTQDITVAVYNASNPYDEVDCDIEHTSTNTITLRFSVAPAAGAYRVVIHG